MKNLGEKNSITQFEEVVYSVCYHLVTKYSLFKILFGREPEIASLVYPLITSQHTIGTVKYFNKLTKDFI